MLSGGRRDLLGPMAVVAAIYLAALAFQLHRFGGEATGFVQFGSEAASVIGPPKGAYVLNGSVGYDGQAYYLLALDPTISEQAHRVFEAFEYRAQRIAYPALAWATAAGRDSLVPWTLVAVNLALALAGTVVAAAWLRRLGRSGWLALAVGLTPGVLLALLRDLTDIVGVVAALAGLYAWSQGRSRLAGGALAVAVLGRETMLLTVAAVGYDAFRRRGSGDPVEGRAVAAAIIPPLVAFAAWELYLTLRFGGTVPWTTAPGDLWQLPGVGLAQALPELVHQPARQVGWDLLYAGLVVAAVVAAVANLWRDRGWLVALAAAQAVLTILLGEVFWTDHWSFTRASAPLLVFLLFAGVAARSRASVAIPCAAAGLTLFIPVALNTSGTPHPAHSATPPQPLTQQHVPPSVYGRNH